MFRILRSCLSALAGAAALLVHGNAVQPKTPPQHRPNSNVILLEDLRSWIANDGEIDAVYFDVESILADIDSELAKASVRLAA